MTELISHPDDDLAEGRRVCEDCEQTINSHMVLHLISVDGLELRVCVDCRTRWLSAARGAEHTGLVVLVPHARPRR